MRTALIITLFLPMAVFSQGNSTNPPLQQQVYNFTNVNEVNDDENPVSQDNNDGNKSNNMFVIQTTVQGPQINVNDKGGPQMNGPQIQMQRMMMPNFSSGGSGSFSGKSKSGFSVKRSLMKADKGVQRICKRHNKRKHSTSRCFSWR